MRRGVILFCFLFYYLAWIGSILCVEPIQLDFENICHHQFTQGCPVHDSDSWKCAKMLANCSGDKTYHCVHNTTGQPFTVIHICASLLKCPKGTIPVYDAEKKALSCELCQNRFYQPVNTWSDETPECLERHKCEEAGHKIECDMGAGSQNIQDAYCRCDARNGYVLTNWEHRGQCVEWTAATCYFESCPVGQARLLNYSCAPPCDEGQKRDDNDMCAPIGTANINQTAVIGNMNITDEVLTKTTRTTPLYPTTAAEKLPIEINNGHLNVLKIVIIVITVLSILSIIGLVVCWKWNILQKCKWSKCKWSRKQQVRRQSISDAHCEVELENMAPRVINVFNVQNLQCGDGNVMTILKPDDQAVTNGDAAGLDSSSVENQGRKACVDEERGNPNINPPDCPGNFRSIHDETDAVYNLELMVEVAKSVGIIRGPGVQGTGFRVGESCIMTALHVVRGIINPAVLPVTHKEGVPPVTHRGVPPVTHRGVPNLEILEDPMVYIDFDYSLPNDTTQHGQTLNRSIHRFNFEPIVCYENEVLDTAVLKLKRGMWDFPCKLTRFGYIQKNLPMRFVGHSEGKVKQMDKSKPREDVTSVKIQECQKWSKQHPVGRRKEYRGYEGAENQSKILFDCTFSKGASGSPGFIISSHMPYIVTMLLRGYPDWLYDENVSKKEKTGIQDGYTFEQGVCLSEVYDDMKVRNPELCLEIFGA